MRDRSTTRHVVILFASILSLLTAHAAEKTAFEQALENEGSVTTQERWVEYGGTPYREVEYKGNKYYIKFASRQGEFTELDCRVPDQKPNLIQATTSSFHRTKLFISFLQENCKLDAQGQVRQSIALDPRLGFSVPDDPHFPIKDRTIFWNPLASPINLGFAGSW